MDSRSAQPQRMISVQMWVLPSVLTPLEDQLSTLYTEFLWPTQELGLPCILLALWNINCPCLWVSSGEEKLFVLLSLTKEQREIVLIPCGHVWAIHSRVPSSFTCISPPKHTRSFGRSTEVCLFHSSLWQRRWILGKIVSCWACTSLQAASEGSCWVPNCPASSFVKRLLNKCRTGVSVVC